MITKYLLTSCAYVYAYKNDRTTNILIKIMECLLKFIQITIILIQLRIILTNKFIYKFKIL
jgi:hypothetical protein